MAERYTILQHNTNTFYVVDCPILLVSHALTKDNQNNNIFIQCKFENTLSKPIKALYVHINCFDVTNNHLPDVDSFSYLDIEVKQYQTFGDKTPIVLPDKETRSVSIIPTKIVFVDGSTWKNDCNKPFELFHIDNTPISELGELAEEYKRELHGICLQSDKHKYLPANKDGYTICGCGKILVDAEKTCPACGVNLEKLFALHDVDKLQEALEQYKQEQDEREEQEKEKRKKQEIKRRRYLKIGVSVACLLVVAFGIYKIASHISYQNAFEYTQEMNSLISAAENHSLGLKDDGTVVATGQNDDGQCNVEDWTDVIEVSVGDSHSLGLKSDGTVVATGYNYYGQCDVDDWTDIIAISAGALHSLGLKSDGTVVVAGKNSTGKVEEWEDIIAISAGDSYSLGLKSDGTVVATGNNDYGQCNVGDWENIVQISTGNTHSLGLKSDGTVVATGNSTYDQCKVDGWKNIIAISAGGSHSLGLKSDGTVVTTNYHNPSGIENWKDIVLISAGNSYSLGLQSDGQVVAVGNNYYGQCDVEDWNLW